jgi:hypothetical protein
MGLLDRLRKVKGYINDAEQVYDALKQRGDPDPLLIALPLVYKRVVVEGASIDPKLAAFAGSYLSTRYPELTRYFVTPEHRQAVDTYFRTLDDYFSGNATDGQGSEDAAPIASQTQPPAQPAQQSTQPISRLAQLIMMKLKEGTHG